MDALSPALAANRLVRGKRGDRQKVQGLYKIKTIAQMTGLSATLLRAWERRYGLLHPERTETGHRLYTTDDVHVLRGAISLIAQGLSIGEIVALGRDHLLSTLRPATPVDRVSEPVTLSRGLADLTQGAVQASLELDEIALARIIDQAFESGSTIDCLEDFVLPASREIGRLWSEDQATVASEHVFTALLSGKLQTLLRSCPSNPAWPRALCACFPDEPHEIGALLLAYHLHQLEISVAYLGACLPLEDLERAIQIKRPHYVFLSATRRPTVEIHIQRVLEVSGRHPRVIFVMGGAGFTPPLTQRLNQAGIQVWNSVRPLRELTVPAPLGE